MGLRSKVKQPNLHVRKMRSGINYVKLALLNPKKEEKKCWFQPYSIWQTSSDAKFIDDFKIKQKNDCHLINVDL